MSKPLNKYSTRDLLILEKRGNSRATREIDNRIIADAARRAPQPVERERKIYYVSLAGRV